MADLRAKSTLLTGYLEFLLNREFAKESKIRTQDVHLEIATPSDHRQRGAQLSLMFSVPMSDIHSHMMKRGIVVSIVNMYWMILGVGGWAGGFNKEKRIQALSLMFSVS